MQPMTAKIWSSRHGSNGLWGKVWVLFCCCKFVAWKVQRAEWNEISASYPYMRIAIGPLKKFRMVDIEYNVECLNDEFVSMPCRDWNEHQNLTLKNFV